MDQFLAFIHLLFHVAVHLGEVVLHDVVSCSVWDCAEFEGGLQRIGIGQATIFKARQIGELLSAKNVLELLLNFVSKAFLIMLIIE